jgi:hypothetical protein
LKITLTGVKPPVWRRLLIPSEDTLAEVHEALLTGMGWSGYHLYAFRIGHTSYPDIDDGWPDDSVDPASVRLGDVVGPGDKFTFECDYVDSPGLSSRMTGRSHSEGEAVAGRGQSAPDRALRAECGFYAQRVAARCVRRSVGSCRLLGYEPARAPRHGQ